MSESAEETCPIPPDSPEDTLLLEDLRVVHERRSQRPGGQTASAERLEGTRIDRYVLTQLLGEGGMAQVYRAIDPQMDCDIAIKVLKPQYRADSSLCSRLEREARGMARIEHENVVRILGFPRNDNISAIAMELVPGGTLRRHIGPIGDEHEPLAISDAVELTIQAAHGLGAAHNIGMVHRDIKPSNLLLTLDSRVKVADFGTILVMEQTTWLTGVGQRIGTPAYMSPEQCRGQRVTRASDVYSLGVTLFELITGRLPFVVEEASPFAMMLKHMSDPAPDPRVFREEVPDWLADVLIKCLTKNPDKRYQTGNEFADALVAGPPPKQLEDHCHEEDRDSPIDVPVLRRQLRQLPQRAIIFWACRCARRVQYLNPDPRVERALEMAESGVIATEGHTSPSTLSRALTRIGALRAASLKAAYADDSTPVPSGGIEAARAAAAAASSAAARCVDDAAADAAFAARSAIAALQSAQQKIETFWKAARDDYQKLRSAQLGAPGTIGKKIPPELTKQLT